MPALMRPSETNQPFPPTMKTKPSTFNKLNHAARVEAY
jgi:hypothetical protein